MSEVRLYQSTQAQTQLKIHLRMRRSARMSRAKRKTLFSRSAVLKFRPGERCRQAAKRKHYDGEDEAGVRRHWPSTLAIAIQVAGRSVVLPLQNPIATTAATRITTRVDRRPLTGL